MELQQLRYVVAVAETGSFTRAAERCHIVQSAISHQIKAVEREVGTSLFARSSRRVELTPAGEAFLPHARAGIDSAERAVVAAVAASGEVRGTLTIGVIPTVTAVDLPGVLGMLRARHPRVAVRLRAGSSHDFVAAIEAGTMDAALLGLAESTPPGGVAVRVLARERLVAVVGERHRLGARRRVRLHELAEEPFADFPEGSPGREQSELAFAAAGVVRDVAIETMSTQLLLDLIRGGLAVGMLPSGVAAGVAGVRALAVVDGPRRVEYLAWSGFNPSPAALAFVELCGGSVSV